jgi:dihydrofolate reductase
MEIYMANAKIIGIMACASNGVVGNNGQIPWHYPEEFKHFRDTIGKSPIVLGRRTFESLPESILKDRLVIVFSQTKHSKAVGVIFVSSLEEFLSLNILSKPVDIFMIGGAQLANLFLENKLLSEFILTKLNIPYDGDAVLNIKAFDSWKSEVINKTQDYVVYKKWIPIN